MKKALSVVAALLLVVVASVLWSFREYLFESDDVTGDLIDATLLQSAEGRPIVVVLTDGSLRFFSRSRKPGQQTQGASGMFCKTRLYWYDPTSGNVLRKIVTSYEQLPPDFLLVEMAGKLWQVSANPTGKPVIVNAYHPADGKKLVGTQDFLRQLGLGTEVLELIPTSQPPYLATVLTTAGQKLWVDLARGTKSEKAEQLFAAGAEHAVFVVADPQLNKRRRLWLLRSSDPRIKVDSFSEMSFRDTETLINGFKHRGQTLRITPLVAERIFLNGAVIYQDGELAIILHQNRLGEKADRSISCVDAKGKLRWTLEQKQLFPTLALSPEDPYSELFFVKSFVRVKRRGELLLVVDKRGGIMMVEAATGKVRWRMDTH